MTDALDQVMDEENTEPQKEETPGKNEVVMGELESKGEETKEEKKEVKKEYKKENKKETKEEKGKDAVDLVITKDKKELDFYPAQEIHNDKVESHFKRIKLVKNESLFTKDFLKNNLNSYKYFSCGKKNPATGKYCDCESLSCPDCMKNNRKMYDLRWDYFINDRARLCSFKKNKVYCNGRFKKVDKIDGIEYSYFYVCGHSGQCEPCSRLNQVIDKYLDPKQLEKLRKRDEKMNYII